MDTRPSPTPEVCWEREIVGIIFEAGWAAITAVSFIPVVGPFADSLSLLEAADALQNTWS